MLAAVLLILGLCVLAPRVARAFPRRGGILLSLVPAGITIFFARQIDRVMLGDFPVESYEWAPAFDLALAFRLDGLSLVFSLLVTGIGALVVLYAGTYLEDEPKRGRFLAFLLLFMASMLGLVVCDNLIALFVFWELTSISSYLLIGFHHEQSAARASALQALLVTGGGGLALLLGLIVLGHAAGTTTISALPLARSAIQDSGLYTPILLLVLLGAFTKSAQFPLHFWLPNGMTAPTPASTYLHAATMVKAGIYLLARLSPSLGGTELWTYSVTTVGALTMLAGGVQAMRETALKRILAFTTVSALGMLVLLAGLGTPLAARALIVFVVAHALYKGALFFVAGILDHETGEKDVLALGGLRRAMPKTALIALIASLSMAPLPPLLGFVAKEMLYESIWSAPWSGGALAVLAVLANMMLMAAALMLGLEPYVGPVKETKKTPHDPPWTLWLPPAVLAALGLLVPFGLGPFGARLVDPAGAAVHASAVEAGLSLWHGLTPALALSVVTTLGGVSLYLGRRHLRRHASRLGALDGVLVGRWFGPLLDANYRLARAQTKAIQSGSLTAYLEITLVFACVFAGAAFLRVGPVFDGPALSTDVRWHELVTVGAIIVATISSVRARSRLFAILAMGIVGYGIVLIFVFFGAPDLAITLFVVETLTVVLFVLAFRRLPRFSVLSSPAARLRDAAVAIVTGAVVTTLLFVAIRVQTHPSIGEYFGEHSLSRGYGRNIVNVILVDFRALDTLGEITVLGTAAIAVAALLQLRRGSQPQ